MPDRPDMRRSAGEPDSRGEVDVYSWTNPQGLPITASLPRARTLTDQIIEWAETHAADLRREDPAVGEFTFALTFKDFNSEKSITSTARRRDSSEHPRYGSALLFGPLALMASHEMASLDRFRRPRRVGDSRDAVDPRRLASRPYCPGHGGER